MKWVSIGLALTLLAGCSTTKTSTTPSPTALHTTYTPHFSTASCPFKIGSGLTQGRNVRCGYLIVSQDRNAPRGPTIRLAVAIFKSPRTHPAPDPVIFLQGGPGGRIVKDLGSAIDALDADAFLGTHDLILIDQRGNGYSRPALTCQEVNSLILGTLTQNLSPERQATLLSGAVRRCHARLTRNINLNAYTTLADAADIADLRRALGYKQVDVYAVSYGTRVALTMMRAFPAGIRSVILDSVYAPQINTYTDPQRSEARLFKLIFTDCARSRACNKPFPHVQTTFYRLITRLNTKPVIISTKDTTSGKRYRVLITGFVLADLVSSVPYVTPLIPTIPKMIYQASRGNFGLVSQAYGDVEFTVLDIDLGTYYSVECGEDAPFTSAQAIKASVQSLPGLIRHSVLTARLGEFNDCKTWRVPKVDPVQKQPVRSSIPTLVMEGQYDPITPPADGALAARTLSHHYFFVFPGTGHGARFGGPCPNGIALAFFDNPTRKPDTSCIATMPPPFG